MRTKSLAIIIGLVACTGILSSMPLSESHIPPTRAFLMLISGNQNVTAQNSTATINLVEGSNIDLILTNSNNTVKISSTVTGNNTVYRCVGDGTLPDGTLTTNNGNCLSSVNTGLKVN